MSCRDILSLSTCSKVLKGYVNDWLTVHFNHFVEKEQHNCLKHQSTTLNHCNFVKFSVKRFNSQQKVHVIYSDFC